MKTAFIPKETRQAETRVAATPETVSRLVKQGFAVTVERGAGVGAFVSDEAYRQAGASIGEDAAESYGAADLVLKVNPPIVRQEIGRHEANLFKEGALLVSFLWPHEDLDAVRALVERRASAFAMERIPRISRAQSMDALSSQANIAGYEAAVLAAQRLPKLFPLLMTAAGTITPARVVVMGAGVAGLQAIATARRLGAVVEVSDVRRVVKEQVESLGARFIEVEGAEDLEGEAGYAREASREFLAKQQALVRRQIIQADAVITTALVPGRPAPRLVTAEMVREMRAGAVIVDLAVEQGGNCELSVPDREVVRHGVTILAPSNLPAGVPVHASEMYAKNVLNVVRHLHEGTVLKLDLDDEITESSLVLHEGAVRPTTLAGALRDHAPEVAHAEA